ncbi:hypothetical protein DPMN_020443, partial [Dreissena polymorpha]
STATCSKCSSTKSMQPGLDTNGDFGEDHQFFQAVLAAKGNAEDDNAEDDYDKDDDADDIDEIHDIKSLQDKLCVETRGLPIEIYLDILKIVPEQTMTNQAPLSLMNRLKKPIELSVSQSYFDYVNEAQDHKSQ